MDPLVETVGLLCDFFDQHGIRFMLIGGLANAVWGRPRATSVTFSVGFNNSPKRWSDRKWCGDIGTCEIERDAEEERTDRSPNPNVC